MIFLSKGLKNKFETAVVNIQRSRHWSITALIFSAREVNRGPAAL